MMALDWVLAGLVALSVLFGLARGAIREIAGLSALVLGGVLALMLGPRFVGLFHFVPFAWLARWVAIAAVFLAVFIAIKLLGAVLSRGVRLTPLSGSDRLAGAGFGAGRGVIACALVALAIGAVFPLDHRPEWISRSRLFPLAADAGAALSRLAPKRPQLSHHEASSPISGPPRQALTVDVETRR
ncbi:MAG TPA: CvpA family protein [Caulobacteraceae bacterium]|jgi:membrane protein required for colicin V production|nr:CvpA family protein [Caulobacteraceae bacterium]